jgi:hypothetical protein
MVSGDVLFAGRKSPDLCRAALWESLWKSYFSGEIASHLPLGESGPDVTRRAKHVRFAWNR